MLRGRKEERNVVIESIFGERTRKGGRKEGRKAKGAKRRRKDKEGRNEGRKEKGL